MELDLNSNDTEEFDNTNLQTIARMNDFNNLSCLLTKTNETTAADGLYVVSTEFLILLIVLQKNNAAGPSGLVLIH